MLNIEVTRLLKALNIYYMISVTIINCLYLIQNMSCECERYNSVYNICLFIS